MALFKGGNRYRCAGAKISTSLSQSGQSAVLGLGFQQSTWHLAAFARFRSSHSISQNLVQFVGSTAASPSQAAVYTTKSRDLILDLHTSHQEALTAMFPYWGQPGCLITNAQERKEGMA